MSGAEVAARESASAPLARPSLKHFGEYCDKTLDKIFDKTKEAGKRCLRPLGIVVTYHNYDCCLAEKSHF